MGNITSRISENIKNWWLYLLMGIVLIIAAVLIYVYPVASYVGLTIFFVAALLVSGIFEIAFALSNSKVIPGWGWTLAGGILDLIVGMLLAIYPGVAGIALPFFVGFWLMFKSIYAIARSFELQNWKVPGWGWILALGILTLILSFLFVYNPLVGAGTIVIWASLALLFGGIFYIYWALKLRSAHKWMKNNLQE